MAQKIGLRETLVSFRGLGSSIRFQTQWSSDEGTYMSEVIISTNRNWYILLHLSKSIHNLVHISNLDMVLHDKL